jgi:hypothetical protein
MPNSPSKHPISLLNARDPYYSSSNPYSFILHLVNYLVTTYSTQINLFSSCQTMLEIHSGFYPWGSVGFVKCSAQHVRNVRN